MKKLILHLAIIAIPFMANAQWQVGGNLIGSSSRASNWLGTDASTTGGTGSDDLLIKSLGLPVFEPFATNLSLSVGFSNAIGITNKSYTLGYTNSILVDNSFAIDQNNLINARSGLHYSYAFGSYITSNSSSDNFFAIGHYIGLNDGGGFVIGTGDANASPPLYL